MKIRTREKSRSKSTFSPDQTLVQTQIQSLFTELSPRPVFMTLKTSSAEPAGILSVVRDIPGIPGYSGVRWTAGLSPSRLSPVMGLCFQLEQRNLGQNLLDLQLIY